MAPAKYSEVPANSLSGMHALRERTLLHAVEALLRGRRLTLMDIARSWPSALRVRAPLKAVDRLLSNRNLQVERSMIDHDMAQWLVRGAQPVIVIDWGDFEARQVVVSASRSGTGGRPHAHLAGYGGTRKAAGIAWCRKTLLATTEGTGSGRYSPDPGH
ncbi:hypothetical protein FHR47_001533 [Xanthomonas arboricola]|nr:hypothetical protein [Xanthomonas cannabis]